MTRGVGGGGVLAATRRRINLRGRLEDYSNLKLVKINVYIYIY